MKAFLKELWTRLNSETPAFFNRLKVFGASLASTGASLKLIQGVPQSLSDLAGQLIVAGGIMVAMSQLTIKHPEQQ